MSALEEARRLKALLGGASDEPWETRPNPDTDDLSGMIVSPKGDAELGNWMVASGVRWRENRAFICAARNDLGAILDAYIKACEALEKIATVGNTDRQIKNAVTGNMEGTAHLSPGGHAQCRMIARAALSCSAPPGDK